MSSFFKNKIKKNKYDGYANLREVLIEEAQLGLYKHKAEVISKHEKYADVKKYEKYKETELKEEESE